MNCENCDNNKLSSDAKFCPECLKRYMPEPIKVEMKLVTKSNFPDKYVCPECGYEKLA
ncbi:MAG: zinc ribbon domain-containing protein [Candidatus Gribaldobacteria bacterium]|nr:zinc ribbon domain-containing protein [Candidatus Gribaldobacteria bacterium]